MKDRIVFLGEKLKNILIFKYPNLYFKYTGSFFGCKLSSGDRYYVFFISIYKNSLYFTYRNNVNKNIVVRECIINKSYDYVLMKALELVSFNYDYIYLKTTNTLKSAYYNVSCNNYDTSFSDDDYEKYLNFGIDLGTITNDLLRSFKSKIAVNIFKNYVNLVEFNTNSVQELANKYNVSKAYVNKCIKQCIKFLQKYKFKYIEKMNEVFDNQILNYVVVGIINVYNYHFLSCLIDIVDKNLKKGFMKNIFDIYRVRDYSCYSTSQFIIDKIWNCIKYPDLINYNCHDSFEKFSIMRKVNKNNNMGIYRLYDKGGDVFYESELECQVLDAFYKCSEVKKIKTQSIRIDYYVNGIKHYYYPDFQILTNDGCIVIVEVKDTLSMFSYNNLYKYLYLKRFCEEKGYGYVMLNKSKDFDSIVNKQCDIYLESRFLSYVKKRVSINKQDLDDFVKFNGIHFYDVFKIMFDRKDCIRMTLRPFAISYFHN